MVPTSDEGVAESAAALDNAASALLDIWSSAHNAADVPVPSTQLRALFAVEHGPVNVSRLAEELGALVSSASRLCDRLEAAGLLNRNHGRDRREVSVRLSADGQALLDRLRVRRREELAQVLGSMSTPARAALLWGLTEFQEAASKPEADGDSFPCPPEPPLNPIYPDGPRFTPCSRKSGNIAILESQLRANLRHFRYGPRRHR